MNTLPLVLENIIMYHKKFLDHQEKNKNILKDIKSIGYVINNYNSDSWRDMSKLQGNLIQCYGGLNQAYKVIDSVYEVWIHTYTGEDEERIQVIMEEEGLVDIIDN
jgi:hypothetical protein